MPDLRLLTPELLDALGAQARKNQRLRQNLNFHDSAASPAQRLLNAIEPGSYVVPHRHLQPERDETLIMLRGSLGVIIFADSGEISATHTLAAGGTNMGFHLASHLWHSVLALETGTVFFEAKDGPYIPLSEADRAAWAPAENTPEAAAYLKSLQNCFSS